MIERAGRFTAVEVKWATRLATNHFSGLTAIKALKGVESRLLVYPGTRDFITADGVQVIGLNTFLEKLAAGGL